MNIKSKTQHTKGVVRLYAQTVYYVHYVCIVTKHVILCTVVCTSMYVYVNNVHSLGM